MHVALALVVAVASVGCASVSQAPSPPEREGDPTVDLAEAPSSSTDGGVATTGATGDLALPSTTTTPPPWQADLPAPPFSWWVTVAVPTQTTVCQPSCRTQRGTAQLAVRVAVNLPGVVELTFNEGNTRTLTGVSPTGTFAAGAGYTTSTGWGHWNATGHIAPGRLIVIDSYSKAYQYEVGMFDSWSDDAVSIGAGQARF